MVVTSESVRRGRPAAGFVLTHRPRGIAAANLCLVTTFLAGFYYLAYITQSGTLPLTNVFCVFRHLFVWRQPYGIVFVRRTPSNRSEGELD